MVVVYTSVVHGVVVAIELSVAVVADSNVVCAAAEEK